ncbi:hypothetical protein V8G54_008972, partial [Vigna mungo]
TFVVLLRIFNLENISPVHLNKVVAIWGFCNIDAHEGMHMCSLQRIQLLQTIQLYKPVLLFFFPPLILPLPFFFASQFLFSLRFKFHLLYNSSLCFLLLKKR